MLHVPSGSGLQFVWSDVDIRVTLVQTSTSHRENREKDHFVINSSGLDPWDDAVGSLNYQAIRWNSGWFIQSH